MSPAQLLVIDDEPQISKLFERWLRSVGHECASVGSATEGQAYLEAHPVDLVTLDIRMPDCSGLSMLEWIKERHPDTAVLMLTGEADAASAIHALTQGAYGYLIKPIDLEALRVEVENGLERRRLALDNRRYLERLELRVREQTTDIRLAHEESIQRLVTASMFRDTETGAHIKRTGSYSELIASAAGWDRDRTDQIRLAAPMHDIGKIGIPDAILRNPGKLSPEEIRIMQTHTVLGAKMLAGSRSAVLQMASEIALCHHERWDGRGYPQGLVGSAIPQSARIVAIADVYDALSHDRRYRPALSEPEVLKWMREGRGGQFDPYLLDTFISVLPEMRAIATAIHDDDDEVRIDFGESLHATLRVQAETGVGCG
jgi:putative two-component system response regulator